MMHTQNLPAELVKLDQAIAAQEALRGVLDDAQLDAIVATLREKRAALLAQLTGPDVSIRGRGNVVGDHSSSVVAETYIERQIVSGETSTDPAALRRCYLNHLYERVRRIALSGIDPEAASKAEARLNLGAVYTALRTLTSEERDRLTSEECDQLTSESCLPERLGRGKHRLSALAQLDRYRRLVLLGDPGSGKSTFVSFVTLCLAGELLGQQPNLVRLREPLPAEDVDDKKQPEQEQQPWRHGALLPVRVVLRDFAARGLPPVGEQATAKYLWDFIAAELEAAALGDYAPHLAQHLQQQGGLILLDGLDEVPEAQQRREQLKQAVEDFAATFRKCRFLVTSRTYAYQQQAWRLETFTETVLAPFDKGQIRRFVQRWYDHIAQLRDFAGDEAQGRAALLQRAIFNSDRLRALAERPLLLTLMASLHAWRGGSLPEKREELYAATVDLLLDWWERPKAVRDAEGNYVVQQPSLAEWLRVDREKVRDLLEHLAYTAHAAQPALLGTADVPEGDLLSGLLRLSQNPEANLAQLIYYLSQRAGLLVPRGVGVYTFPHRTFQEYLAACHLTDFDYPEQVAELARQDPNRWREVALLAGAKAARGTASAVWSLVDALCYQVLSEGETQGEPDAWGALLAGQALVENANLELVSERNRTKVARVQTHLARVLEEGKLPAVERVEAGKVLAQLGDPRPGVGAITPPPGGEGSEIPDILWVQIPPGPFLMGSADDDTEADDDEKPQHTYQIEQPYAISRYPITNAQFATFVAAGGYREARYWTSAARKEIWSGGKVKAWRDDQPREGPHNFGESFNLPNHPVVGVTWYETVAFCRWLGERLKVASFKLKVWTAAGVEVVNLQRAMYHVQLPTEPQWEKAARGATGWRYPWGPDPNPEKANYHDTGIGTTSAVGCFPGGASPYGVLEMSGNVWEWCRTKWESGYEKYQNDVDLESNAARVLRGGAFLNDREGARCACRFRHYPLYFGDFLGFRVVVSPFRRAPRAALPLDSEASVL